MLPKRRRVGRALLEEIMKKGRSLRSPHLILRFFKTKGEARLAVVVPGRVARLASKRNYLRRRISAIIETLVPKMLRERAGVLFLDKEPKEKGILVKEAAELLEKSGLVESLKQ